VHENITVDIHHDKVKLIAVSAPRYYVVGANKNSRTCGVYVSPTPTVTWSRLDTPMPTKNSDASFGQELIVDAAEFSDSGRYQCIAVNTASGIPRAVVDFTLSVECESALSLSLSVLTAIFQVDLG